MNVPLRVEVANPDLLLGIVEARGVPRGPASAALAAGIDATVGRWRHGEVAAAHDEGRKAAIRDLLRGFGYKPTGRGKPASEYLAQAAARGEFPRISHCVDAINLMSLDTGLPISVLDLELALRDATELVVRLGQAGEKYVFNAAGHEIDIAGLLCIARRDGSAIGTPVKDSMAAKTTAATRDVVAVVWASRRAVDERELAAIGERLAGWFAASQTTVRVLG